MQKVVIVIPTYNEREQVSKMIEALAELFKSIKDYDMNLLFADDSSPDGTYKVVQEKMKKYPWLHLALNKKKMGIGGGYATGFRYAMKELNADYVVEMDCDFQHRPIDLLRLLEKIKDGYDLVIGSRYVPGGKIPDDWGFKRKFFSVVGNWICRIGFLQPKIHDFTTGFKLTKVKGNLDEYNLDGFYSNSFAYKIQMSAEMANSGKKIVEVPIVFEPRTEGESKLIKNELGDFLRTIFLFQLHNPKMIKLFKFGIVGFIGFIVNYIALRLLRNYGLTETLSWAFSTELAIVNNFIFNNIWTFKEQEIKGLKQTMFKFLQFNLTSAGAIIIQSIAGPIGVRLVGVQYDALVLAFVVLFLVLPYNFTMYNLVIWRKKK
ncbi:MAG: glycosyltransferase family 2 protein [Patescibacteria group bacterium]